MAFQVAELLRNRPLQAWTYADLDRRQQAIRKEVLAGAPGKILLSEVAPVVTLGIRHTIEDLLFSAESFEASGIDVYTTSRGGRATYHGPGQWIAFPVESLERLTGDRKGVRKATQGLLQAALSVCLEKYPMAEIREGKEAGVWSHGGPTGGKLAALGLRFEGGVLQHGLALNIYRTRESFLGIKPCGLDAPVAFLEKGAPSDAVFLDWGVKLERAILQVFPGFLSMASKEKEPGEKTNSAGYAEDPHQNRRSDSSLLV